MQCRAETLHVGDTRICGIQPGTRCCLSPAFGSGGHAIANQATLWLMEAEVLYLLGECSHGRLAEGRGPWRQ